MRFKYSGIRVHQNSKTYQAIKHFVPTLSKHGVRWLFMETLSVVFGRPLPSIAVDCRRLPSLAADSRRNWRRRRSRIGQATNQPASHPNQPTNIESPSHRAPGIRRQRQQPVNQPRCSYLLPAPCDNIDRCHLIDGGIIKIADTKTNS